MERKVEEYKVAVANTNVYIKENIEILYEDNHLLVVVKPKGMLSQGDDTKDKNLLDILKEYIRIKESKKGDAFLGLVQRLDRPTSGIMVFAKTSKAASRISKEIRERKLKKKYIAVLDGYLEGRINIENKVKNYMVKDHEKNMSKKASKKDVNAKEAKLIYKILGRSEIEKTTLVEVNLLTGRSHQIRFTFSDMGHPIIGDIKYAKHFKYGKKTDNLGLFAYYLKFKHPTKDIDLEFKYAPFKETNIFNKYKDEILELIYN